jgi:lysozyme family protein
MSNFVRAFPIVVGIEAGFSNDPADPGNWTGGKPNVGTLKGTKFGISAAVYPDLDIENLVIADAQAIYLADYWNKVECDSLPWPMSCFVFDCAVNEGQGKAVSLLQNALGVKVDGDIGPVTTAAASSAGVYQTAFFMTLRAFDYMQDENFAHDGHGWFNRLFQIALGAAS